MWAGSKAGGKTRLLFFQLTYYLNMWGTLTFQLKSLGWWFSCSSVCSDWLSVISHSQVTVERRTWASPSWSVPRGASMSKGREGKFRLWHLQAASAYPGVQVLSLPLEVLYLHCSFSSFWSLPPFYFSSGWEAPHSYPPSSQPQPT